jgi:hypothetical protein
VLIADDDRVNQLLGAELDAAEVSQVLERGSLKADLALSRTSVTVSERPHALQGRCQLVGAYRLRDMVVHAGRETGLAILG